MFFSSNLNKLVKVGFVISIIIFIYLGGSIILGDILPQIEKSGRVAIGLIVIAGGLTLSLLLWGALGTLTEIALELRKLTSGDTNGANITRGGNLKNRVKDLNKHANEIDRE